MASRGHLTEMCNKTKMCMFFLTGSCGRGGQCKFAHSKDELKAPPDLRCTKLCPVQAQTGNCSEAGCAFAHDRTQLRKLRIGKSKYKGVIESGQPLMQADGLRTGARNFGSSLRAGSDNDSQPQIPVLDSLNIDESKLEGFMLDPVGFSRQSTAMSDGESCLSELESFAFSRQPTMETEAGSAAGPPPRVARNKFFKTKMCCFFLKGKCKKATSCNFAHNPDEMYQLPDLTCTKLCSTVLNGGICTVEGCTFAHCPDELRIQHRQQGIPDELSLVRPALPAEGEFGLSGGGGWREGLRSTRLQEEALQIERCSGKMERLVVSPVPTDASQATTSCDDSSSERCLDGLNKGDGASAAPIPVRHSSDMRISVRRNSVARAGIQEPCGPKSPMNAHAPADSQPVLLFRLPEMRLSMADRNAFKDSRAPAKQSDGHGEDQTVKGLEADPHADMIVTRSVSRFRKLEKQSHSFDDSIHLCVKNTFIELQEQSAHTLVRTRSATF
mmetsp:Transcript_26032/g.69206  ORF Transcript_26032/g.69206 Transcript_26032/m.69206 type:complete len:499 (-) Transcript_26032:466-1962(-)